MNCKDCQSAILDLLLDSTAPANTDVRAHIESCSACTQEFKSMQATFALLDTWQAPNPSHYFDQKLAVRLREEQTQAPAGWLEQLKSRLLFNTGRQLRPALAGGLALVLLVGGGTYANLTGFPHSASEASAAVQDLQILDKNDQALQTMDQLLQDDGPTDDSTTQPLS
jgi:hypothetical protein